MLFLKRRLYNAVMEKSIEENISFHQIIVKACLNYTGLICKHKFMQNAKRKDGRLECIYCGLFESENEIPKIVKVDSKISEKLRAIRNGLINVNEKP